MSPSLEQNPTSNATGVSPSTESNSKPVNWQALCHELMRERDQLQAELSKVKDECKQYKRAVLAMTKSDFEFDKDDLLSLVGQEPSLQTMIAELERRGA